MKLQVKHDTATHPVFLTYEIECGMCHGEGTYENHDGYDVECPHITVLNAPSGDEHRQERE